MSRTKEEGQALLQAIRENRRRLDECPRHLFELPEPPYQLGQKFHCSKCAGFMPAVEANQYIRGYEAAGGNANDVAPGFRGQ